MPVSEATYKRVALEDPTGRWEYVCGELRRKPELTSEHAGAINQLDHMLQRQLDIDDFEVRTSMGRLRISTGSYYVPDLCVVPRAAVLRLRARPGTFEVFEDPVPLVVEMWSPSTGSYDLTTKLREYQGRRDAEIWIVHPYRRTVRAWRRGPDGAYTETTFTKGTIQPVALPGVAIALARLFE